MKVMMDAREGCSDTFEPALQDDDMLLLDLGSKGQYSLQPAANDQLLLFSPLSGPKYYHYDVDNRWWCAVDDGHLLDELLVRELMHITSVYLNL
jgi:frataxin-like iron-binding protein CyaY